MGQSQISSVDFNNLRKQQTNLSDNSTISTVTTKSNNPLTRLFTRNRSQTTINAKNYEVEDERDNALRYSDGEEGTHDSPSTRPSRASSIITSPTTNSLLKLGKKSRSKFTMTSKRPDLSIHTAGHHGLKVPKKIRSAALLDEVFSPGAGTSGKKSGVASPGSTFHNFFHRSHTSSQPSELLVLSSDDHISQQSVTIPSRTAITLSSNSSNSVITDVNFALIFKFTNPNYSLEEPDSTTEHSTLIDMHRKLLTPTDQFLQSRVQKMTSLDFNARVAAQESDIHLQMSETRNYAKLFQSLTEAIRPLILVSQSRKLSNGCEHACLSMLLEDLGTSLLESYINITENGPASDTLDRSPSSKSARLRKLSRLNSSSNTSLNETAWNHLDDFRFRETHAEILSFFTKCMTCFLNDFNNHMDFSVLIEKDADFNRDETLLDVELLCREWAKLEAKWDHFNKRIRFQMLAILHPLQRHFNDRLIENPYGIGNTVRILTESMLLSSFRDVIVMPFILNRLQIYKTAEASFANSAESPISNSLNNLTPTPSHSTKSKLFFLKAQEARLLSNGNILGGILNCFGTIRSHMPWDLATERDRSAREEAFMETFNSLLLESR